MRPNARLRGLIEPIVRAQEAERLRTRFVAGTGGTLLLNVGSLVLAFATTVVLGRVLGARGYGGYVYALGWVTMLAVPALLGMPQLVVRELAAHRVTGAADLAHGVIRRAYRLTQTASAVVVLLALPSAFFIARGAPAVQRAYAIGLLTIPLVAVYRVSESAMRGSGRVIEGRLAETTVQPVALVVMVLLTRAAIGDRLRADTAMALTLAAAGMAAAVSLSLTRRSVPAAVRQAPPRHEEGVWWRSLRPLFVLSVIAVVHAQITIVMVGALTDVTASGVFNAALKWAGFVSFAQVVLVYPLGPALARLRAEDDRARAQRLLSASAAVGTAAAVPIAVLLVVFRGEALGVFGPSFTSGGRALTILAAGEVVNVACGGVAVALVVAHRERVVALVSAVGLGATVVLGFVLIPRYGLEGAAVSRAVAVAGGNVALLWQLHRREGLYAGALGRRLVRPRPPPGSERSSSG